MKMADFRDPDDIKGKVGAIREIHTFSGPTGQDKPPVGQESIGQVSQLEEGPMEPPSAEILQTMLQTQLDNQGRKNVVFLSQDEQNQVIDRELTQKIRQARQMGCIDFSGKITDVVQVKGWIDRLSEIMPDMELVGVDKVAVATKFLVDDAEF